MRVAQSHCSALKVVVVQLTRAPSVAPSKIPKPSSAVNRAGDQAHGPASPPSSPRRPRGEHWPVGNAALSDSTTGPRRACLCVWPLANSPEPPGMFSASEVVLVNLV